MTPRPAVAAERWSWPVRQWGYPAYCGGGGLAQRGGSQHESGASQHAAKFPSLVRYFLYLELHYWADTEFTQGCIFCPLLSLAIVNAKLIDPAYTTLPSSGQLSSPPTTNNAEFIDPFYTALINPGHHYSLYLFVHNIKLIDQPALHSVALVSTTLPSYT
jgi:hypothetical protein